MAPCPTVVGHPSPEPDRCQCSSVSPLPSYASPLVLSRKHRRTLPRLRFVTRSFVEPCPVADLPERRTNRSAASRSSLLADRIARSNRRRQIHRERIL